MTSAQFQSLCVTERHEALDRMTPEQMIDFTECFTPSAGLPVSGESCWRTLALRLAIELREERGRHEQVEAEPIEDLCPNCDSQSYSNGRCSCCGDITGIPGTALDRMSSDPTTQALEAMPAADVALAEAAKGWEG